MTTELLTLPLPPQQQGDLADPWIDCATAWLEAVERRRGSARSRNEYQKILTAFFQHVAKAPASVSGSDVQRWISTLHESGLAKNTINTRLAAVSSFYAFACAKFEVEPGRYLHNFNPATVVQREHVNPYEKAQGLSIEGAKALLAAFDPSTTKGLRDRAITTFYLYTGRRCIEVARLLWADLRPGDEIGQYEYHYQGKGGKGGWRDLPGPAWTALESYLKASGRLASMKADSPLFTSTIVLTAGHTTARIAAAASPTPISPRQIAYIVDGAAKRAGLGHLKVHALRHTAAKLKRKAGDGIEEVSAFLDHSSIATTQIYLGAIEAKKDKSWRKVEDLLS